MAAAAPVKGLLPHPQRSCLAVRTRSWCITRHRIDNRRQRLPCAAHNAAGQLHPGQITSAITTSYSLDELQLLTLNLHSQLNPIHIAAVISRAAKLVANAGSLAEHGTGGRSATANQLLQRLLCILTGQHAGQRQASQPLSLSPHMAPLVSSMGARELCNALWGLGSLRLDPIVTCSPSITPSSPPSASSASAATSRSPHASSKAVMVSLATLLVSELVADNGRKLQQCSTQEAANAAWALARLWPSINDSQRAAQLVVPALGSWQSLRRRFQVKGLTVSAAGSQTPGQATAAAAPKLRHALAFAAALCLGAAAVRLPSARPQEVSACAWAAAELGLSTVAAPVQPVAASTETTADATAAAPMGDAEDVRGIGAEPWWQQPVVLPEKQQPLQWLSFPVLLCKAVAAPRQPLGGRPLATVAHSLAKLRHRDEVALAAIQKELQMLASQQARQVSLRDVAMTCAALAQLQAPGLAQLLPTLGQDMIAAEASARSQQPHPQAGVRGAPKGGRKGERKGSREGAQAAVLDKQALLTLAWAHAVARVHVPWMVEAVLLALGLAPCSSQQPSSVARSGAVRRDSEVPRSPTASNGGGAEQMSVSGLLLLDQAQAFHYLLVARDAGWLPDWVYAGNNASGNDLQAQGTQEQDQGVKAGSSSSDELFTPAFAAVWRECQHAWLTCRRQRGQSWMWEAAQPGKTGGHEQAPAAPAGCKPEGEEPADAVKPLEGSALQQDVLRVCQQLVQQSGGPEVPMPASRLLSAAQVLPEKRTADGLFSIDIAILVSASALSPSSTSGAACLAVEVDGPSHYTSSVPHQLLGATLLRNRCLEARGWTVIGVPWWEWDARAGDEQAKKLYLSQLLASAVITMEVA